MSGLLVISIILHIVALFYSAHLSGSFSSFFSQEFSGEDPDLLTIREGTSAPSFLDSSDRMVVDVIQDPLLSSSEPSPDPMRRWGVADHSSEKETVIPLTELREVRGDQSREVLGDQDHENRRRAQELLEDLVAADKEAAAVEGEERLAVTPNEVEERKEREGEKNIHEKYRGDISEWSGRDFGEGLSSPEHSISQRELLEELLEELPAELDWGTGPVTPPQRSVESNSGESKLEEGSRSPTPYENFLARSADAAARIGRQSYAAYIEDPLAEDGTSINLSTQKYEFMGYFSKLRKAIQSTWSYPRSVRGRGMTGRVKVRFVILKDGQLGRMKVVSSSGYAILDDRALLALREAAPFDPLPWHYEESDMKVTGVFTYLVR